jgi:hypothetical protein
MREPLEQHPENSQPSSEPQIEDIQPTALSSEAEEKVKAGLDFTITSPAIYKGGMPIKN